MACGHGSPEESAGGGRAASPSAAAVARALALLEEGRTLAAAASLPPSCCCSGLGSAAGCCDALRAARAKVEASALSVRAALRSLGEPVDWPLVLSGEGPLAAACGRLRGRHAPPEPGGRDQRVWFEAPLPGCSAVSALALAREWDLVSAWNHYLLDTRMLSARGLFDLVVYGALWTPYPLAHRDFVVSVSGHDLLDEHGLFLLVFASADGGGDDVSRDGGGAAEEGGDVAAAEAQPEEGGAASAAGRPRCRMRWREAAVSLRPAAGGAVGRLVAQVDPALPGGVSPPGWALRWALFVLCPAVLRAALRVLAALGGPGCAHAARAAANPALYGLLAGREAAFAARAAAEEGAPVGTPEGGADGAVLTRL